MHLPAYKDGTECCETSAYKIQMPGNHPKESIQHSGHGESLKSRIQIIFFSSLPSAPQPTQNVPLNAGFLHDTTDLYFCTIKCEESIYRVSQEECAILRESVPYVKLYQYNPKHLYPKLNGYGDNGQRSLKL